jgi:hypothetical protein
MAMQEASNAMSRPGAMLLGSPHLAGFLHYLGSGHRQHPFSNLGIVASASVVRALRAPGLIDRHTLLIGLVTLGTGGRLVEHPASLVEFTLTRSVTTTAGVIIAHYERR